MLIGIFLSFSYWVGKCVVILVYISDEILFYEEFESVFLWFIFINISIVYVNMFKISVF